MIPSHRPRAVSLTDADASASLARRLSAKRPPEASDTDRVAKLLREIYDDAVAEGLPPAPDDLTGWRVGTATVTGPGTAPEHWAMRNTAPTACAAREYEVSREILLATYVGGELVPPSRANDDATSS